MAEPLAAVDAGADSLPPSGIFEIPAHCFGEAGFESLLRRPTEFVSELRGVDGVAPIMARPVGDKGDEGGARLAFCARRRVIEQPADRLDNFDIGPFAGAADIVAFADT